MTDIDDNIREAFRQSKKRFTNPFLDSDRDRVPNIIDCEPENPDEQGIIHDWLTARKEKQIEKEQELLDEQQLRNTVATEESEWTDEDLEDEELDEQEPTWIAPSQPEDKPQRPLGGTEGKIYLYIKTDPLTYTLHDMVFNSRIEATHFAEENFKGHKYKTMSQKEIDEMLAKNKTTNQEQQKVKQTSKDVLKNMLEESYKKAYSEGLTAGQLSGGLRFSHQQNITERQVPVEPVQREPIERHGLLTKTWSPKPFKPSRSQWNGPVGKKIPVMPINAPHAKYAGPRFDTPHKSMYKINVNTHFQIYKPPIYGRHTSLEVVSKNSRKPKSPLPKSKSSRPKHKKRRRKK